MKTMVVYDSTYGNTERIARLVAEVVEAHVPTQVMPVAEASGLELQAGDLLVIGCPTQGHTATLAIQVAGALPAGVPPRGGCGSL